MKEAVQMVEKRKEHATQAHIPAAQEIPFEGFTQTEQKIMLILYYSYHGLTGWQVYRFLVFHLISTHKKEKGLAYTPVDFKQEIRASVKAAHHEKFGDGLEEWSENAKGGVPGKKPARRYDGLNLVAKAYRSQIDIPAFPTVKKLLDAFWGVRWIDSHQILDRTRVYYLSSRQRELLKGKMGSQTESMSDVVVQAGA